MLVTHVVIGELLVCELERSSQINAVPEVLQLLQ
jgi:hypothetical protein